MKTRSFSLCLAPLAALSLSWSASAGEFHFPVGISYTSGASDATDKLVDLYRAAGYRVDDRIDVPFGLTFNPYYEFDFGLGIGMGLGPTAFFNVREDLWNGRNYRHEDNLSCAIPIGADVRYTFLRDKVVSPYVRVGFRYPIVGGDNVESSQIGPFGAIGAEFWRSQRFGFSAEFGYDGSEITVKGPTGQEKDVTFAGFTAALSIVF